MAVLDFTAHLWSFLQILIRFILRGLKNLGNPLQTLMVLKGLSTNVDLIDIQINLDKL